MTFSLAVESSEHLGVHVGGGAGHVTAVAREPVSETAWITLPPLQLMSEITDLTLDVAVPSDPVNPFAGDAMLVTRVVSDDDAILDLNCFAPVSYSVDGESFVEVVSFVADGVGGRPIDLAEGETTRLTLRLGATDPGGSIATSTTITQQSSRSA